MNRLKSLRKNKNLTLRELSEITKISHPTLSRLENEEIALNQEYLLIFSDFYNVSVEYILGISDDPKPTNKAFENSDKKLNIEDNFLFALYDKVKDLSKEQKEDIIKLIDIFIKNIK